MTKYKKDKEENAVMLKGFAKLLFAVVLILVSASLIIQMKYSISFNEYLAYSQPLTREEQQFLKEKKSLTYGIVAENAPFTSKNEQTGDDEGLTIDYIDIISQELNIPIYEKVVEAGDEPQALREEQIDITELFSAAKGSSSYVSTQPVYKLDNILVTLYENKKINYIRDLNTKKIAVLKDEFLEKALTGSMPKGQTTNFVYVPSMKTGLTMLAEGKVDAVAGTELTINYYAQQLGMENSLRHIGDNICTEDVALAVSVYNTKLYNILNKTLLQLKKDGAFDSSQKLWLGSSASMVTNSASVRWAEWIIIVCVAIVELLMFWESVLNRRIEKKTLELRIEKKNLQTIIDNIDALIAVISGDDIITQCNAFGKRLLGDERASFLGCGIGSVEILGDLYRLYSADPNAPYYAYRHREYAISVRVLNPEKGTRLIRIEDCTESNLAERKLRQENKMAAVGQLSAGLAHEIRNPLGLIKNYSYILQDYATDDMAQHSLDVIKDSVGRIDSLIENLLRFSRLSNDTSASFNLEKLLQSILSLERKKLDAGKIEIALSCPQDFSIRTREETVKILAFNLINNAAEAIAESGQTSGKIEISVTRLEENNLIQMIFSDNGPGMDENQLERVFDPFFTTKDTGTGLGLYIVSTEVEKVGGQISLKSTPAEGTTFTVLLPDEKNEEK